MFLSLNSYEELDWKLMVLNSMDFGSQEFGFLFCQFRFLTFLSLSSGCFHFR